MNAIKRLADVDPSADFLQKIDPRAFIARRAAHPRDIANPRAVP